MEAGAWASVKIMLCFANFSTFGVFRVLAIALVFGIKLNSQVGAGVSDTHVVCHEDYYVRFLGLCRG